MLKKIIQKGLLCVLLMPTIVVPLQHTRSFLASHPGAGTNERTSNPIKVTIHFKLSCQPNWLGRMHGKKDLPVCLSVCRPSLALRDAFSDTNRPTV